MYYFYGVIIVAVIAIIYFKTYYRKVIVMDFQKGLKYKLGNFDSVLSAGRYWVRKDDEIRTVDIRENYEYIPNQEIITSDGVSVKLSLIAVYKVSDPKTAMNDIQNFQQALYATLQTVVREVVSKQSIDDIIENRSQLNKVVQEESMEKISKLGLEIKEILVRDVMLTGELKKILTQIVAARKEGVAKLERTRGETAALRNLANAAKMIDDNPNLLKLRILDVINQTSGNTIIMGTNNDLPIIKK